MEQEHWLHEHIMQGYCSIQSKSYGKSTAIIRVCVCVSVCVLFFIIIYDFIVIKYQKILNTNINIYFHKSEIIN